MATRHAPPAVLRGRRIFAAFILGLLFGATAWAGDLADVRARGKLIMLCYPPLGDHWVSPKVDALRERNMALKDLHDPNDFTGLDIELIQGFAASLGVRLEIQPVPSGYDDLLAALAAKDGDLVASSLTITARRQKAFDFSDPYQESWMVVAAPKGSKLAAPADLSGKKAALMLGSSQLELVRSLGLDVKVQLTDFAGQSALAVTEGEADFTIIDSPTEVGEPISDFPGLYVAQRLQKFGYGVALRKGSDLAAPLNAYLAKLRSSGELVRLAARYFPHGEKPLPALAPKPESRPDSR